MPLADMHITTQMLFSKWQTTENMTWNVTTLIWCVMISIKCVPVFHRQHHPCEKYARCTIFRIAIKSARNILQYLWRCCTYFSRIDSSSSITLARNSPQALVHLNIAAKQPIKSINKVICNDAKPSMLFQWWWRCTKGYSVGTTGKV